MINYRLYFLGLSLIFLMMNCQKRDVEPIDNKEIIREQIIGEWITEAFHFEMEDSLIKNVEPYIILNEYGSGFTLDKDQSYYTFYTDKIGKGTFRGTWELLDEKTILFKKDTTGQQSLLTFTVDIEKLEKDLLWIKEKNVEYQLIPVVK